MDFLIYQARFSILFLASSNYKKPGTHQLVMGDHLCDETLWSIHGLLAWSIRKHLSEKFSVKTHQKYLETHL